MSLDNEDKWWLFKLLRYSVQVVVYCLKTRIESDFAEKRMNEFEEDEKYPYGQWRKGHSMELKSERI